MISVLNIFIIVNSKNKSLLLNNTYVKEKRCKCSPLPLHNLLLRMNVKRMLKQKNIKYENVSKIINGA